MTKDLQAAKRSEFRSPSGVLGRPQRKLEPGIVEFCVTITEQERFWPRCGTEAPALCSRKAGDERDDSAQARSGVR